MVDDGLVVTSAGAIAVSETGRFFIRNVCMAFDRYLEKDPSARVYSRTV
jgi:oxygen-independent coproporphyrinogen-3 oxidase